MSYTAYSILWKERRNLVLSLSFTGSLVFSSIPALVLHFYLAPDKADENSIDFPLYVLVSFLALFGYFCGIGLLWEKPSDLRLARLLPMSTGSYYRNSVYTSLLFFFASWSVALFIAAFTSIQLRYVFIPFVLSSVFYYITLLFRDLLLFTGSKLINPDLGGKIIRNLLIFVLSLPVLLSPVIIFPGDIPSFMQSGTSNIILLLGLLGIIALHIHFGCQAAERYCGYHFYPDNRSPGSKKSYMMSGPISSHVRLALSSLSTWIIQPCIFSFYYFIPSDTFYYIGSLFLAFFGAITPIYFIRHKWIFLFFSSKDQKKFFTVVNVLFLVTSCSLIYTLEKSEVTDLIANMMTTRFDSDPKDVPLKTIRFIRASSRRFDNIIRVTRKTESKEIAQYLCESEVYYSEYGRKYSPTYRNHRKVYFNPYAIRPWEQDLDEALTRADTVCRRIWGIGLDKELLARQWRSGDLKPGEDPVNGIDNSRKLRQRRFFYALELELGKAGVKAAFVRPEINLLLLLLLVVVFQLLTRGIFSSILAGLVFFSFFIFLESNCITNQFQPDVFLTTVFRTIFQDNNLLFWSTVVILFSLSTLAVWTKDYRKLLKKRSWWH